METVKVSELSDDELIGLMYEVLGEVEARIRYGRPVRFPTEERKETPFRGERG